MGGFLGMRGNGDWVADQRPLSWRQQILKLYPNGDAPLTAILSMMGSEKVTDPQFHWWTKVRAAVAGEVLGVYSIADLSVPYAGGGVIGDTVFVQITTVLGNQIRTGHQILLRDGTDWTVDVNGKITGVTRGNVNTVLAVRLLENDDNSLTHDLSNADNFKIIGNINPEGGEMPDSVVYNPEKIFNYTQIFRTSMSMTRTAKETTLRTGDQTVEAKADILEQHSWEQEQAFIWGIPTERIGDNGKPERTTMGLIPFIRQYAPANCDDYSINPTYAGQSWVTGGKTWLNNMLELIFRYGASEKLVLCGSGFLLGIQSLVGNTLTSGAVINLEPVPKVYGMDVRKWVTPFGSVIFKTHPLMSHDVTTRFMGTVLEPKELKFKYITDTKYISYPDSAGHLDGDESEYITEAGLEFGLPQKCAVLNGVGQDNALVP